MKAAILAAGQIQDYEAVRLYLADADTVVCADGGAQHARQLGLKPDLLLGDFDSADPLLVQGFAEQEIPVQRFPVEKDKTDTQLALETVLAMGADEIVLTGVTGSRLDHTMTNILLLPALPRDVRVTVVDGKNVLRVLPPGGKMRLLPGGGDFLSLVPLTPVVTGVLAQGVKWPLEGATLRWGESLGVSNVIVTAEARLAIQEGYLLVVQSRD